MINQYITSPLALGLTQAGVVTLLALLVLLIARQQAIHLERETIVALVRGLVQIVAVGAVLTLLLSGPSWTSVFILLAMTFAAAVIAARRARGIRGAIWVSFGSIACGAGLVIGLMTWVGVIDPAISSLVPVGSMIISNTMNATAQALERFRSEVESHQGYVESALALGAAPAEAVAPYTHAAVVASMIPRIDSISSLGIVWIPGLMAGMILSGSDPVYAAIYQYVVLTMIYAASGITALVTTFLIRTRVFSAAEQLVLSSAPLVKG